MFPSLSVNEYVFPAASSPTIPSQAAAANEPLYNSVVVVALTAISTAATAIAVVVTSRLQKPTAKTNIRFRFLLALGGVGGSPKGEQLKHATNDSYGCCSTHDQTIVMSIFASGGSLKEEELRHAFNDLMAAKAKEAFYPRGRARFRLQPCDIGSWLSYGLPLHFPVRFIGELPSEWPDFGVKKTNKGFNFSGFLSGDVSCYVIMDFPAEIFNKRRSGRGNI
ncbi:hypothetical protein FF38_01658 [Lucilia cuprina]|uniref:Uncharacterized protein n=1 Tax=Lucilia cuprina TaxID=7375 RepID=A0A0L0BRN0_LUCCU|nr:hypothetical protein FF38_01658 [Lucilia cuprina]